MPSVECPKVPPFVGSPVHRIGTDPTVGSRHASGAVTSKPQVHDIYALWSRQQYSMPMASGSPVGQAAFISRIAKCTPHGRTCLTGLVVMVP